jgi:conflict system pore-forming effector with SLATT domain
MNQRDNQHFLKLFQVYRFEHQLDFYRARRIEFSKAQTQAIFISIGLIFLAAVAGAFAAVSESWLKVALLLVAAIFPVLSTAIAGYSVLYAFEQQAKLYQDTLNNLLLARSLAPDVKPGLSDTDFTAQLDKYVIEVEKIYLAEQGQWGQLAKLMKPSEV